MKQISRWTRFRLGDSACRHCRFHTSSRLIEPRQLRHYLLTAVTLLLDDSAGRFLLNSHGPRAFSKYWILGNEYCCVKTSFRSPHLAAQLNGFYFQIRHLEVTAVWWRIVLTNLWWFLCLQSVAEYRANVPSTCKVRFSSSNYSLLSPRLAPARAELTISHLVWVPPSKSGWKSGTRLFWLFSSLCQWWNDSSSRNQINVSRRFFSRYSIILLWSSIWQIGSIIILIIIINVITQQWRGNYMIWQNIEILMRQVYV